MSSSDAGALLTCVAALPRASQPCWKVLALYNPPNLRRLDYGHLQVTEQAMPQFLVPAHGGVAVTPRPHEGGTPTSSGSSDVWLSKKLDHALAEKLALGM